MLTEATCSQAQIAIDGTVSTEVTSPNGRDFEINGGKQVGGNLFHSFGSFSVITGGSATFNNSLNVHNIISRVTGHSISSIDGLISARGNANFFLINPNGIILGPNAHLNIGGSVVFSTADRLNFADGSFFSATNTEAQPLLTISVPIGLQFGNNLGKIASYTVATDPQVRPDKTLALVGGDIMLDGVYLLGAQGGRIEIGSVASNSFVGLTAIPKGWSLNYEAVSAFQDIQLSEAIIGGIGIDGIQLQGKQVVINDSLISTINLGTSPSGNIVVRASNSVEISNGSALSTTTGIGTISSTESAGNIAIETPRLFVSGGSEVRATTEGRGQGGNINVNTPELLEIDGQGFQTRLTTQTFGRGNAGDINVTTGRLVLREGGQITVSAVTLPIRAVVVSGDAGRINIAASDSVEISGQGVDSDDAPAPSSLIAKTSGLSTTGNGGSIRVDTGRLFLQDEGAISVSAEQGSTGQAGSLTINAASVVVNGSTSTISAASTSPKPAGDVTINTNQLLIGNGASINVNSQGAGSAGNLFVSGRSIELNDRGEIAATSSLGNGGNITLQAGNTLLLRTNSQISTTAGTAQAGGDGGNIIINAPKGFLVTAPNENNDITANAFSGRGGNITINATGIYWFTPRSRADLERLLGTPNPAQLDPRSLPTNDITAISQGSPTLNGTVILTTPNLDPSRGLVQLPVDLADASRLIVQNCPTGDTLAKPPNEFIITGRGGLPPTPSEAVSRDAIQVDLVTADVGDRPSVSQREPDQSRPSLPSESPIVEAQGWQVAADGTVFLVATAPQNIMALSLNRLIHCR